MKSAMNIVKVMSRFLSARLLLKVVDNEFCKGGEKALVCVASVDKLWFQLLPQVLQLNGFQVTKQLSRRTRLTGIKTFL